LNRLQLAAGTIGLVAAALSVTAWQKETSVSASPGDGADLFMRKGCASCHNGPETTARIGVAPSLADVREWAGTRRPGLSAADYVRESILNPPAFISPAFEESGPTAMPSLNLTDAEVDALVAYLLASETSP
jgi:mono/diheme cytochrome c family protein